MNAKTEQWERSHHAILASAANILRQRGIAGASVAEIMKGAGLTVGAFYAHFKSKQELIDESLRGAIGDAWDRLFSYVETQPPAARIDLFLRLYLSETHRDGDTSGCPFPAVVGEIGTTAPEHRAALSQSTEPLVQRLEKLLPDLEGRSSARLIAVGVLALLYGGLSLSRAVRGTALSNEILEGSRLLGELAIRQAEAEHA